MHQLQLSRSHLGEVIPSIQHPYLQTIHKELQCHGASFLHRERLSLDYAIAQLLEHRAVYLES